MGRIVALVVAVLLVVAGALVWLAPATLVAPRLDRATAGGLTLADADGTVWNGRGALVAGGIGLPLAWAVDPLPLAKGELVVRIAPRDGAPTGPPRAAIALADGRANVRDVDVVVPAAWLAAAAGARTPWWPTGDVAVAASTLVWAPPASAGTIQLEWRDARIASAAGSAPVALGTVTATLTAAGDRLAGPVANQGGDLAVAGDVAVRAGGEAQVSLLLTPRRSDDTALAQSLARIGTPEGAGWRATWRGRLR